ncbi:transposase family protein [Mycobacterium xenopi 3993]|nr:transposase family protein [Mycobacterium xenopi 3993]
MRPYRESDPKPVIAQLARQLNVHPEALRNWIRQDEADRGERDDRPTTEMIAGDRRLRAENKELRRVNEVLRAASAYFARRSARPGGCHEFHWCSWLLGRSRIAGPGIAPSTYYGWRKARRQPSRRAREDAELLRLVDEIRGESEFAATYGSPRVWLELRNRGIRVGRKRVERIMRENGRQGAYLRRGWKHGSTRQNPKHTAAPICSAATSPPPHPTRSGSPI